MFAKAFSAAVLGIDGYLVEVECYVAGGLPEFRVVGLPGAAVRESADRVRAALRSMGHQLPLGRVTVNLAPAHIRKEGPSFDLAIAVSLAAAAGRHQKVLRSILEKTLLLGELSLDGTLRPVTGVLPAALAAARAGMRWAVVPPENAAEAAASGLQAIPAASLAEALGFLGGQWRPRPQAHRPHLPAAGGAADQPQAPAGVDLPDLSEVRGQREARRALEIAAAGFHHLILVGPPGTGKTLLAHCLPGLLPPLAKEERLEVSRILSVAGMLRLGEWEAHRGPEALLAQVQRPFRSPHHSCTVAAMVGGGGSPRPGEVTLAHRGVLLLDEFPEFRSEVVESLRQPLEDGVITISRANQSLRIPARPLLALTANPCACGRTDPFGLSSRGCTCKTPQRARYAQRLSGPVMDRIHLWIPVGPVPADQMLDRRPAESSARVRERVTAAWDRQRWRARREALPGWGLNGTLVRSDIRRLCTLDAEGEDLLLDAAKTGHSARALDRMLTVARTVADLAGSDRIEPRHLREALSYRRAPAASAEQLVAFNSGERGRNSA